MFTILFLVKINTKYKYGNLYRVECVVFGIVWIEINVLFYVLLHLFIKLFALQSRNAVSKETWKKKITNKQTNGGKEMQWLLKQNKPFFFLIGNYDVRDSELDSTSFFPFKFNIAFEQQWKFSKDLQIHFYN